MSPVKPGLSLHLGGALSKPAQNEKWKMEGAHHPGAGPLEGYFRACSIKNKVTQHLGPQ